jgi:hypothetical protein
MPRYFVHENRHYPCPGARTPFEVRAPGFMDATIEFCATQSEADAQCNRPNSELEDAEGAEINAQVARTMPNRVKDPPDE